MDFKTIKETCESDLHLLVDEGGDKRLYVGFTRGGSLVTDREDDAELPTYWTESEIESWTIEPYEPPKQKIKLYLYAHKVRS